MSEHQTLPDLLIVNSVPTLGRWLSRVRLSQSRSSDQRICSGASSLMISLPWYISWKSQRAARRVRSHFHDVSPVWLATMGDVLSVMMALRPPLAKLSLIPATQVI